MCYFISLVVTGGAAEEIEMVLHRHGRQAMPFNNASVRSTLHPDEAHFITTVGHCDCGTVLSPQGYDGDERNDQRSKHVVKLRKKGWSSAKIERWVADRTKADERAVEQRRLSAPDNVELWTDIIGDLLALTGVRQAGLLVHYYSGFMENEVVEPTRKAVSFREFAAQLQDIQEDQILLAKSASV